MAIRYGSQTVDPVTGMLVPVVGARLDVSRKHVVPVTASYWLMAADQTESVEVGNKIKEVKRKTLKWFILKLSILTLIIIVSEEGIWHKKAKPYCSRLKRHIPKCYVTTCMALSLWCT